MTNKEKRARQSEARRAAGLCLVCGKPIDCHHCYGSKARHDAGIKSHAYEPLFKKATCADCGRRSNEYRKMKKASEKSGA